MAKDRRAYDREYRRRKRRAAGVPVKVRRTREERLAYQAEWHRNKRKDPVWRAAEKARRARKRDRTTSKPGPKPKPKPKAVATLRVMVPRLPKPKPVRAPSEMRAAWRRAHRNSQLRRLYPAVQDLDVAWRDGKVKMP